MINMKSTYDQLQLNVLILVSQQHTQHITFHSRFREMSLFINPELVNSAEYQ